MSNTVLHFFIDEIFIELIELRFILVFLLFTIFGDRIFFLRFIVNDFKVFEDCIFWDGNIALKIGVLKDL